MRNKSERLSEINDFRVLTSNFYFSFSVDIFLMYKTVKELGGYQQVKIHLLCTDHKITIEHLQLGQQFNKSFHINIFNHNGV